MRQGVSLRKWRNQIDRGDSGNTSGQTPRNGWWHHLPTWTSQYWIWVRLTGTSVKVGHCVHRQQGVSGQLRHWPSVFDVLKRKGDVYDVQGVFDPLLVGVKLRLQYGVNLCRVMRLRVRDGSH